MFRPIALLPSAVAFCLLLVNTPVFAQEREAGADGVAIEGGAASFGSAGMNDTNGQWNTGTQTQNGVNQTVAPPLQGAT